MDTHAIGSEIVEHGLSHRQVFQKHGLREFQVDQLLVDLGLHEDTFDHVDEVAIP